MLEINNLSVQVANQGILTDVTFKVLKGRTTAIVGGSGSGKTTIANCILNLLPEVLQVSHGQILFDGKNLLSLSQEQMRQFRGHQIAMIFQEPLGAFNPLMKIGQQLDEVLLVHTQLSKSERKVKVLRVLERVQLDNPKIIYERYPHQLSGGERQRAMIAQALVGDPKLVIADEPTSNLDVTLQARMMSLFKEFKKDGLTMLLISHDLGFVSRLADDIVILERGVVVEQGLVDSIVKNPRHSYTKALMEAA